MQIAFESALTRQEFVRHALSRHFRRPMFYIFAFVAAVLTAYAFMSETAPAILYLAAWLPLLIYAVTGWISLSRQSRDNQLSIYQTTLYTFSQRGIELNSRQGRSTIRWPEIQNWRKVIGIYELVLTNGQVMVIAQRAVPPRQLKSFEDLLKQQIQPKPESGIFDK